MERQRGLEPAGLVEGMIFIGLAAMVEAWGLSPGGDLPRALRVLLEGARSATQSNRGSHPLHFRLAAMVEAWGFEPQTYSLQSYRSTN